MISDDAVCPQTASIGRIIIRDEGEPATRVIHYSSLGPTFFSNLENIYLDALLCNGNVRHFQAGNMIVDRVLWGCGYEIHIDLQWAFGKIRLPPSALRQGGK